MYSSVALLVSQAGSSVPLFWMFEEGQSSGFGSSTSLQISAVEVEEPWEPQVAPDSCSAPVEPPYQSKKLFLEHERYLRCDCVAPIIMASFFCHCLWPQHRLEGVFGGSGG